VASQLVRELPAERAYANTRARVIALLGPLTVVAGIVWAIVQPYRLTLLHPHHQGFWWLAVEPPLLVAGAGIFFALAIARPLLADMEEHDGAAR
jgi:formate hydrogenlyase subunit 3/multisubunit Na+/H+ antiporter MnhD subunit